MRRVIRRLAGTDPGRLVPEVGAGVAPEALAACFRPGSRAHAVAERLGAPSSSPGDGGPRTGGTVAGDGPGLEDLHGCRPARDWGLLLRDEIASLRRGEIVFRELSQPAAVLAGPPVTGKSCFARALARSCGVPRVESSGAAWFETGAGISTPS